MKKALATMALLLVPFFSFANIFTDGSLQGVSPKIAADEMIVSCSVSDFGSVLQQGNWQDCKNAQESSFGAWNNDTQTVNSVSCNRTVNLSPNADRVVCSVQMTVINNKGTVYETTTEQTLDRNGYFSWTDENNASCPPDSHLSYTYPYDPDGDGQPDQCFNPADINLNDSCNASSGNQYISTPVTVAFGCFQQPDGSMCKYDAISIDGKQVYQLDNEGDCYNNPLPDIEPDTNPPAPQDNTCQQWGGDGLVCAEDPNNVCSDSGSIAGNNNVNNCAQGCGYVNDQFMCFTQDQDNDGVPNYKDPDKDGDGIKNEDDLDSDGDGIDDPVNPTQGQGGSANVTVNVDMQGVIDAINSFKNTAITEQQIDDGSAITQLITTKDGELDSKINEVFNSEDMNKLNNVSDTLQMNQSFESIISPLVNNNNCVNPTLSFLPNFDLCSKIIVVKPFLYIIFAFLTFIHLVFRFTYFVKGKN